MTSGLLTLQPDRIAAIDTDPSSRAPIKYTFEEGTPSDFREYFEINPNSGWVKQIKAVNRSQVNKFDLIVKVRIPFSSSTSRGLTRQLLTVQHQIG